MDDLKLVTTALREQYGRTIQHIGAHADLATAYLEALTESGRIGNGEPAGDAWEPTEDECLDIAHAAGGAVREWRAAEIAFYVLLALGRAGRLLPATVTAT